MTLKVICRSVIAGVILFGTMAASIQAQAGLKKKVDSLFIIASSGEVKFQKLVQPAIDSLAAMGIEVVPFMVDKFDTKSPRERIASVAILKKIGSPAVPQIVASLKSNRGLSAERACNALGEIRDTSAVPALSAAAAYPRWRVREEALSALGKIGDQRAANVIIAALNDSIGLVQKAAAVSDGQLKLGQSTAELVHLLGDDFYGARMSAADALLKLDTPTVVQLVSDSIDSENQMLGNLGCYVLGRLGTQQALATLMFQTQSAHPDRRAHAGVAIVRADPNDSTGYQATRFPLETDRLTILKIESAIADMSHGR
jgi:HEAT repeat protein